MGRIEDQLISNIRGFRNCNPGNVEDSGIKWVGTVAVNTDPRFCQFISHEYGIRCLGMVLRHYQSKHGLYTPREIITRYAPGHENDTAAYVNHVCKLVEVKADNKIDLFNPVFLHDFVKAIITHELGFNPYSDELIRRGLALI